MTALRKCVLGAFTMCVAAATMFGASITLDTTLTPVTGTGSTGSGTFTGSFDPMTDVLDFTLDWTGLTTNFINAHIHLAPSPGANGPVLVPFFTPGTIETITPMPPALPLLMAGTLTESIHITDPTVLASFMGGLSAGTLYVNVHSVTFPAGEIRGDLPATASTVPEPGTIFLLGAGAIALAGSRLRKRLA